MAQQLQALAALALDLISFPQHSHGDSQLCNSRSRGSDALCWPLSALDTHSVHLQLVGKTLIKIDKSEGGEAEGGGKRK